MARRRPRASRVKKDPRLTTTPEEYARQVSLALQLRDKLSETNEGVIRIRELRKQLDEYTKRSDKRVADAAKGTEQEADGGGGEILPDQEPRQ